MQRNGRVRFESTSKAAIPHPPSLLQSPWYSINERRLQTHLYRHSILLNDWCSLKGSLNIAVKLSACQCFYCHINICILHCGYFIESPNGVFGMNVDGDDVIFMPPGHFGYGIAFIVILLFGFDSIWPLCVSLHHVTYKLPTVFVFQIFARKCCLKVGYSETFKQNMWPFPDSKKHSHVLYFWNFRVIGFPLFRSLGGTSYPWGPFI